MALVNSGHRLRSSFSPVPRAAFHTNACSSSASRSSVASLRFLNCLCRSPPFSDFSNEGCSRQRLAGQGGSSPSGFGSGESGSGRVQLGLNSEPLLDRVPRPLASHLGTGLAACFRSRLRTRLISPSGKRGSVSSLLS